MKTMLKKSLFTFFTFYTSLGLTQEFTLVENPGIIPVQWVWSSVTFADIDGDGDLDLFTGGAHPAATVGRLYKNDGNGQFTLIEDALFPKRREGSVTFGDVNGDGSLDMIISGAYQGFITKLFMNDGQGNFTPSNSEFVGTHQGDIVMFDYDNDNDLDIIVSGMSGSTTSELALYENDGLGNFTRNTSSGLEQFGLYFGRIKVADLNNDGHLDLITNGRLGISATGFQTRIFINNADGTFSLTPTPGISPNIKGSIDVADVNHDGNIDFIIVGNGPSTGGNPANGFVSELYLNDGNAQFTKVNDTPFIGMGDNPSVAFADFNGDGFPDIISMGRLFSATMENNNQEATLLYLNDGTGAYTLLEDTPFTAHTTGTVVCADVNGDQKTDVLITGVLTGNSSTAKLYLNDVDNTENEGGEGDGLFLQHALFINGSIYPNPTSEILHFKDFENEITKVQLYSENGALIFETNAIVNNQLSLNQLSKGTYTLTIKTTLGEQKVFKLFHK